jgi:hypothetical protein
MNPSLCTSNAKVNLKPDMVVHIVIPALGRLRQEEHEFDANLGYIVKPCLKKPKEKKSNLKSMASIHVKPTSIKLLYENMRLSL